MVNLGYFPKPIIVQINRPAFLDQAVRGAVEKPVANLVVVVTGMIGDAVELLSQRMDCRRPGLRHIVWQTGMCDLGGRANAPKTRARKLQENERARDLQAHVSLPAKEIERYLGAARIAQKGLCKGPSRLFGRVKDTIRTIRRIQAAGPPAVEEDRIVLG